MRGPSRQVRRAWERQAAADRPPLVVIPKAQEVRLPCVCGSIWFEVVPLTGFVFDRLAPEKSLGQVPGVGFGCINCQKRFNPESRLKEVVSTGDLEKKESPAGSGSSPIVTET